MKLTSAEPTTSEEGQIARPFRRISISGSHGRPAQGPSAAATRELAFMVCAWSKRARSTLASDERETIVAVVLIVQMHWTDLIDFKVFRKISTLE
jgi:hypothetical protein